MVDTLSSIPFWGVALLHAAVGAAVGFVQAWRGHPRPIGIVLLLTVTTIVASGWALRWDWNTRTTPLGGSADSEKRFGLEALGTARRYTESRRRWIAMNQAERWEWRLTMFGGVSASLLSGGVPMLLLMTRRAHRIPADWRAIP